MTAIDARLDRLGASHRALNDSKIYFNDILRTNAFEAAPTVARWRASLYSPLLSGDARDLRQLQGLLLALILLESKATRHLGFSLLLLLLVLLLLGVGGSGARHIVKIAAGFAFGGGGSVADIPAGNAPQNAADARVVVAAAAAAVAAIAAVAAVDAAAGGGRDGPAVACWVVAAAAAAADAPHGN